MKIGYLPMVLVMSALVFAGCIGGPAGKNCGTDMTCFSSAAATCEQAYATYSQDLGGMAMSAQIEVRGGTLTNCTFYMKISDITYPASMPDVQKTVMDQMIKNKDMTCQIPVSEASNALAKGVGCTGSLADILRGFSLSTSGDNSPYY